MKKNSPPPKRHERLSQNLRANLLKRKEQQRIRENKDKNPSPTIQNDKEENTDDNNGR